METPVVDRSKEVYLLALQWTDENLYFRKHPEKNLTEKISIYGAKIGSKAIFEFLSDYPVQDLPYNIFNIVIEYGHLDLLIYLSDCGWGWNKMSSEIAAKHGHLHILMWLRSLGCYWDNDTAYLAALNGHHELLEWAIKNGCPADEKAYVGAIEGGHFDIVKWLKDNGVGWSFWVTTKAAEYGNLELIGWLIDQGCPIDKDGMIRGAMRYHNLNVIDWFIDKGWDFSTMTRAAVELRDIKILDYLKSKTIIPTVDDICRRVYGPDRLLVQWLLDNGTRLKPEMYEHIVQFHKDHETSWVTPVRYPQRE